MKGVFETYPEALHQASVNGMEEKMAIKYPLQLSGTSFFAIFDYSKWFLIQILFVYCLQYHWHTERGWRADHVDRKESPFGSYTQFLIKTDCKTKADQSKHPNAQWTTWSEYSVDAIYLKYFFLQYFISVFFNSI